MKIFAVGAGPLPFESSATLYGLGYRTWHIVKPLLDDGHTVRLVAVRIPTASESGLTLPIMQEIRPLLEASRGEIRNFEYYSINEMQPFLDVDPVRKLYTEFNPDCFIGINGLPASVAAKLDSSVPFWADLNGWLMAEAQSKAARNGSDTPLAEFWLQEEAVLHRADIFSTVSIPQKFALLGELAALGRLNAATTGYEFVYHIPNSIEAKEYEHQKTVFRTELGAEAFVVLWSGGYNTWTDIDILFAGLTSAFERNDRIRFVSTGGTLRGHDEKTYLRFQELIAESKFKDRFSLRGWIPNEEVLNYYFESDLGLNIDIQNYETLFGARNRLLHMCKIGLPVLTTLGTEISYIIAENQLGLTFEIGNQAQFADRILYAVSHPEEMKLFGQKAKRFVYENYTCDKTALPIRNWVKAPKFAPDYKSKKSEVRSQKQEIDTSSPIKILKSFFRKNK
ncbi:MAG: glycosyltransferase [bacterium]|nr:glycosyltransferase [bacterium]